MDPFKAHEMHGQLRENAEELNDYIHDLNNWLKDIKKTDEELQKKQHDVEDHDYPPIRNSTLSKTKEDCHKSRDGDQNKEKHNNIVNHPVTFNQIKDERKLKGNCQMLPSCIDAGDIKENEHERLVEKAEMEKEKGNILFKEGKYDDAIVCYTKGIHSDPTNAILPANRAMALMKKGQFTEAEVDCTKSIAQDPTYIKAFHRRGTCRFALKKYQLARQDFLKVMELDPGNKLAKAELNKLEKIFQNKPTKENSDTTPKVLHIEKNPSDTCAVKAIVKPPHLQSKKPLKRVKIEVKNSEENTQKTPVEERVKDTITSKTVKTVTTPVKEIVSPICVPHLPPIPHTAFQFLSDWKKLYKFPEHQLRYIKQLPPEKLPKIFKEAMESEILTDILNVIQKNVEELGNETILSYLKNITEVGRFSTLVLFLSDEEKQAIKSLLTLASNGRTETINDLSRLYRIT